MAVLGGVSRRLSSEGTLSCPPRLPGLISFGSPVGALAVLGTVIQLLGLGIGLGLVGVPPLKVVVSTRLTPWEAVLLLLLLCEVCTSKICVLHGPSEQT